MNFLKEIIRAAKSGGYSGKGNKCARAGDYRGALRFYEKALEHASENSGSGLIYQECISRMHARLGNDEQALAGAEKCLEMLNGIDSSAKPIADARERVQALIEAIQGRDAGRLRRILGG